MASGAFFGQNGLCAGVLGSFAALAFAAPLATGSYDTTCQTDAARIGAYFDRSAGAEKFSIVVGGVQGPTFTRSGTQVNIANTGNLTSSGGQIILNNGTSNMVNFGAGPGIGAPTFVTNSPGTKVLLFDSVGVGNTGMGIGIESGYMWFGSTDATSGFKWYNGTTEIMRFETPNARLLIGSIVDDGVNKLQVTGSIAATNLTADYVVVGGANGQLANSSQLRYSNTNGFMIFPTAKSGGIGSSLSILCPADTNLIAGSEVQDFAFGANRIVQRATGAVAINRTMFIASPTFSFVGASVITSAATVAISGNPIAGTFATITNNYALWVQSGNVQMDDASPLSNKPVLGITQTWNGAGTTFTAVLANITNTASAVGSMLMDLQIAGATKFNVNKTGAITSAAYTATRVPYFGTAGLFTDSANFVFDATNAALTVGGATVTTSNPVLNMTQTWNAAGVTFAGIKLNVTSTASAVGSLLLDLQVATVSKFNINKTGAFTSPAYTSGRVPYISTGGLFADSAQFTYDPATGALLNSTALSETDITSINTSSSGIAQMEALNDGNKYFAFSKYGSAYPGTTGGINLANLAWMRSSAGHLFLSTEASGEHIYLAPNKVVSLDISTTAVTITNAVDIVLATSTGSKIGTATNQKLGLWNAAPVIQYATTGTVTGFTAATATPVLDGSTFTGNTGSTAYTIGDVVRALKLSGIMAA